MKATWLTVLQCICIIVPAVEMKTHEAHSSSELQSLLSSVVQGDIISLLPQDYPGDFTLSRSGSNGYPIKIVGSTEGDKNSRIIPKDTGLNIQGNHWIIENLNTKGGKTGIKVSGSNIILKKLSINGGSTALLVSEDSCCGKVEGVSFSGGTVDFKGTKYQVSGVSASSGFKLSGCDNTLRGNSLEGADVTKSCKNDVDSSNVLLASAKRDFWMENSQPQMLGLRRRVEPKMLSINPTGMMQFSGTNKL